MGSKVRQLVEAREKAEASDAANMEYIEAMRASLAEAKRLLKPFADVAKHDIGDSEIDADRFMPMRTPYNRAPSLLVGDLRAADRFLSQEQT